jgi:NodT family efflux transporter outer membrane factor (OMF) lipoprotein
MVGPDYQPPAAPQTSGYSPVPLPNATLPAPGGEAQTQRFISDMDIPGEWWTLFHSEPLNELVRSALAHNPDLAAAQAALRAANQNLYAREGGLFPSAGLNLQAERERFAGAVVAQPQFNPTFGVLTAGLSVSYSPDVFGGLRRQIESLEAQAQFERFELEAAYLTLTSNLVVAAIEDAAIRAQIAATRQIIRVQADVLGLLEQRFNAGVVSRVELLAQQATLDQTQASLPPLQNLLNAVHNRLVALTGALPGEPLATRFELDRLSLPAELPVSLPSRLVAQRPDVRAAEALLHAASANLGAAIANQLPSVTLAATAAGVSPNWAALPGTGIWSLAGSLSQTLFDAGTLRYKKEAAVALLDQAGAQYRSTVIRAFENVSDALRAIQADAQVLVAQDAAERSAHASLDLARQQFSADTADYLSVLIAERIWQQARISLVQAKSSRFADTAGLFQALGGGWWNRQDADGAPAAQLAH